MSTVRRSSRAVLRATPKPPSGDAQRARAVEPGRQVAERRVAQPQVGVDEGRRARRADVEARRARRRSRRAPAAASAPPPRRPGASAPARDARGCRARAPAPASARCGCRGRGPARSWRDRRSSSVASMFSVTQSTSAAASARRSPWHRGRRCWRGLLAQLGRRADARRAAPRPGSAPSARQSTPRDARTDGTYSIAGTAARSANSCGHVRRLEAGDARAVDRHAGSAAAGAPARRVELDRHRRPARPARARCAPAARRTTGRRNDRRGTRARTRPTARASPGTPTRRSRRSRRRPPRSSPCRRSPRARASSRRACACARVRISAPAGTAISAQRRSASLLSTRTIWCVSVITAPLGKIRITARSSTMTAGAV